MAWEKCSGTTDGSLQRPPSSAPSSVRKGVNHPQAVFKDRDQILENISTCPAKLELWRLRPVRLHRIFDHHALAEPSPVGKRLSIPLMNFSRQECTRSRLPLPISTPFSRFVRGIVSNPDHPLLLVTALDVLVPDVLPLALFR